MSTSIPPAFSPGGYISLLTALRQADYTFGTFGEVAQLLAGRAPFVLLRHDVEVDLDAALMIATLEHEAGARATYFLAPQTPFYSLFSKASQERVAKIQALGHDLGLHADLGGGSDSHFIANAHILSALIPGSKPYVSLHSPGPLTEIPFDQFPILKSVYAPIVDGAMAYLSDSTGSWQSGSPLDSPAFEQRRPLQILTHPVWWVHSGETPLHKLLAAIDHQWDAERQSLRHYLPKLARRYDLDAILRAAS